MLCDDLSELENTFSKSSQTDLNTKKKVLERMVQIVRESGLYEVSHKYDSHEYITYPSSTSSDPIRDTKPIPKQNLNLGEPVVTGTQANPGLQANPGNLPLINPQTLQVSSQSPRLPTFTGDTPVKGGNTAYQVWRFEVSCLAEEECYQKSPGELKHAIRRSLKGKAAESIIYLWDNATVDDILHKLDGLYGSVTKGCVLLKRFFNAQQQEAESVTDWGCRLESPLNQAKDKGSVDPKDMNTLLCTQLYEGLHNADLKTDTHYYYCTVKDFDALRIQIRIQEQDRQEKGKHGKSIATRKSSMQQSTSVKGNPPSSQQLSDDVAARLDRIETRMHQTSATKEDPISAINARLDRIEQMFKQPQSGYNRSYQYGPNWDQKTNRSKGGPIVCRRCCQEGHIAIGCRNRRSQTVPLNTQAPPSRGRRMAETETAPNQKPSKK